jgi:hypothetical protein
MMALSHITMILERYVKILYWAPYPQPDALVALELPIAMLG